MHKDIFSCLKKQPSIYLTNSDFINEESPTQEWGCK